MSWLPIYDLLNVPTTFEQYTHVRWIKLNFIIPRRTKNEGSEAREKRLSRLAERGHDPLLAPTRRHSEKKDRGDESFTNHLDY